MLERASPVQLDKTTAMGVPAAVGGQTVVLGYAVFAGDHGISVENLGNWPERLR